MKRYEYEVLNYWNDSDDLYVHYLVFDNKNKRKADCIDYYNISDIGYNYNSLTNAEIEESLLENIEKNNGIEFKYPKVSNLSKLLKYIYDSVCNSDSNMCHIDYDDWNTMKEDYNLEENDIKILEDEIKKYNLNDLITIDLDGYKICGYGCLQTSFNDDRERCDELER